MIDKSRKSYPPLHRQGVISNDTILSAVAVFWHCVRALLLAGADPHQPIVDLRPFTNLDFALGSVYTFIVGAGIYGATLSDTFFLAKVRLQQSADGRNGRRRAVADGDVTVLGIGARCRVDISDGGATRSCAGWPACRDAKVP
jgi:hypothetical protein